MNDNKITDKANFAPVGHSYPNSEEKSSTDDNLNNLVHGSVMPMKQQNDDLMTSQKYKTEMEL